MFKNGQTIAQGHYITAGNASQLSDGASASVLMTADMAVARGLAPLGLLRGVAVSGCDPDEMGIGPVFAVPALLKKHGLRVQDIDIWELNEAFACQVLYCRDRLGIDPEISGDDNLLTIALCEAVMISASTHQAINPSALIESN